MKLRNITAAAAAALLAGSGIAFAELPNDRWDYGEPEVVDSETSAERIQGKCQITETTTTVTPALNPAGREVPGKSIEDTTTVTRDAQGAENSLCRGDPSN